MKRKLREYRMACVFGDDDKFNGAESDNIFSVHIISANTLEDAIGELKKRGCDLGDESAMIVSMVS